MNNIYTVILGAGEGTRMKSRLPKVLHKAAGKELISHVIDCLSSINLKKTFVVIGSGSDLVKTYLKKYGDFLQNPLLHPVIYGTVKLNLF